MSARTIIGVLGAALTAGSVVLAGALIWIATTEPSRLAAGETSWALPALVLTAVSRVLTLVL